MTTTTNLGLNHVTPGGNAQEVVHNESMNTLDALVFCDVVVMDIVASPTGVDGDVWKTSGLSGTGVPSGDWSSADYNSLQVYKSGWTRIPIKVGMVVWDETTTTLLVCTVAGATDGLTDSTWEIIGTQATTVAALVDNTTGGTPDGTLADLADGSTYATDHGAIEDNFGDLADKINEIISVLKTANLMA